jgi:periplasmic divalent cation tolerance protein
MYAYMYSIVMSAAPSREVALALAKALVDRRLAACVNVVPCTSVYRWEGEVKEDDEHIMVIKTRRTYIDDIRDLFAEEHPYDLPELVAFEMEDGSAEYLKWLRDGTEPL